MFKLVFEYVGDVRAAHPYYYVYTSGQTGKYQRDPFLEIATEKDKNLYITIEARKNSLRLSADQWNEILEKARSYHFEIISKNEEWP
ncbi:hypothetical protein [Paraburkholderia hayleyella]|uniref:hypothetical protein n=1 Tax=Paraburkholderia hayleyella TaxID=2152889 RepID=UPI001290EC41|nr:hypothetical protein [Paraburkholderia hayleyella]